MTNVMKFIPTAEREIVVTRVFDAPRRLVFDAFTKPDMLKHWMLGPDGWSMPVCEMDLRAGGAYRWVWQSDADGKRFGVAGVFREVVAPERIVHTERFDPPWYPGEAEVTILFVEKAGKTTFTMTIAYSSRDTRDGAVKSGMEKGMARSYDRLETLLASTDVRAGR